MVVVGFSDFWLGFVSCLGFILWFVCFCFCGYLAAVVCVVKVFTCCGVFGFDGFGRVGGVWF